MHVVGKVLFKEIIRGILIENWWKIAVVVLLIVSLFLLIGCDEGGNEEVGNDNYRHNDSSDIANTVIDLDLAVDTNPDANISFDTDSGGDVDTAFDTDVVFDTDSGGDTDTFTDGSEDTDSEMYLDTDTVVDVDTDSDTTPDVNECGFEVSDETWCDVDTGRLWSLEHYNPSNGNSMSGYISWYQARDYCEQLDSGGLTGGWRLPYVDVPEESFQPDNAGTDDQPCYWHEGLTEDCHKFNWWMDRTTGWYQLAPAGDFRRSVKRFRDAEKRYAHGVRCVWEE